MAAGGSRSSAGLVVLVLIGGALAVVWGQLSVMVSTLKGPDVAQGGGGDLVATMDMGSTAGGEGGDVDLVAAAEEVAVAVEPVRELADGAAEATAPFRSPSAPEGPSAGRLALQAGDCGAAVDALVRGGAATNEAADVLQGSWSCFAGQSGGIPAPLEGTDPAGLAAAIDGGSGAAGAASWLRSATGGLEGRLDGLGKLEAAGLGGWLDGILGSHTVLTDVLHDVRTQADLAAWGAATGDAAFEAERVFELTSSLEGAAGQRIDAGAPEEAEQLRAQLGAQLGRSGLPPEVRDAYQDALLLGLEGRDDALASLPPPDDANADAADGDAADGEAVTPSDAVDGATEGATADAAPEPLELDVCLE